MNWLGYVFARIRGVAWNFLVGSPLNRGGWRIYSGFGLIWIPGSRDISIGSHFHCRKWCSIVVDGGRLVIGRNVFFNNRCSLNCQLNIDIGDDCLFGENVSVYDHDHIFKDGDKFNLTGFKCLPVKIGSNVWLGTNVVVLKGSVIGNNVVVGANTVVRGYIPDNTVVISKNRDDLNFYYMQTRKHRN